MIGFEELIPGLLKIEGGYIADDAGKGPSNFGINATANPGVDIKNLTKEQAIEIYRAKYWTPVVSLLPENAPDELVRQVFDTSVNMGPGTATSMLDKSGGDLSLFVEARRQRYQDIYEANPEKNGKFLKGWSSRLGVDIMGGATTVAKNANGISTAGLVSSNSQNQLLKDAGISIPDKTITPVDQEQFYTNVSNASQLAEDGIDAKVRNSDAAREARGEKYSPLAFRDLGQVQGSWDTSIWEGNDPIAASDAHHAALRAEKENQDNTLVADRYIASNQLARAGLKGFVEGIVNGKPKVDPNFDFGKFVDDTKTDVSVMREDNYMALRLAQSQQEANDLVIKDIQEREWEKTLRSGSKFSTMGISLVGEFADPTAIPLFAVGGGAVSLARGAANAKKVTTLLGAVAKTSAEGIIGDASYTLHKKYNEGKAVHVSDWITNAALAAGANSVLGTFTGSLSREAKSGVLSAINEAKISARQKASAQAEDFSKRAEAELGPNATPEEYRLKASEYELKAVYDDVLVSLADVPQARKIVEASEAMSIPSSERLKTVQEATAAWSKAQENVAARKAAGDADTVLGKVAGREDVPLTKELRDRPSDIAARETADIEIRQAVQTAESYQMPHTIAPGKTSYKGVELEFSSDFDRAAYALANDPKGTAARGITKSLKEAGLDVNAAIEHGKTIREAIKREFGVKGKRPPEDFNASSLVPKQDLVKNLGKPILQKHIPNLPKGYGKKAAAASISSSTKPVVLSPKANILSENLNYNGAKLKFESEFDKAAYLLSGNKGVPQRGLSDIRKDLQGQGHNLEDLATRAKEIKADLKERFSKETPKSGETVEVKPREVQAAPEKLKVEQGPSVEGVKSKADIKAAEAENIKQYENMTLNELRDKLGIRDEFRLVADINEAALYQQMDDRAREWVAGNKLFQSKSALSGKLNKAYDKFNAHRLNPISTTLIAPDSPPIFQMTAALILENATGAIGGKTAALTKVMLQANLVGEAESMYTKMLNAYYRKNNRVGAASVIDNNLKKKMDMEFTEYRHLMARDPKLAEAHPNHKLFSDFSAYLDSSYTSQAKIQIHEEVIGWENLVGKSSVGHQHQVVDPDKFMALTTGQKRGYAEHMAEEVYHMNPEITRAQADGIANAYMNLHANKVTAQSFIATSPHSRRGAAEFKQAIDSMPISPGEKIALHAKYEKGMHSGNKTRIKRDMLATFTDKDTGEVVRLMDIMVHDPIQLLRSQANRVSGEVAVKQFGINGSAGFDLIKKVGNLTGAKKSHIEAFEQMQAEMLGLPVGGRLPNATAAAVMSATRFFYLGGLVFSQIIELYNIIPALGFKSFLNVVGNIKKGAREAKLVAHGKKGEFTNNITDQYHKMVGETGADQYKSMMPISETGRDFTVAYSAENIGVVRRLLSMGEQAQTRITFFNALLAGQQRAVEEEILSKASRFIREGKNDAALRDMGMSDELIATVRAEKGVFTFNKNGSLTGFDPTKAKNPEAMSDFVFNVRRGTGQIFQESFIGERGTWISSDVWTAMMSMRNYSVTAIQKQMVRQVTTHGPWKAAGHLLGAMSFGIPVLMLKAEIRALGMNEKDRKAYLDRIYNPYNMALATLQYTPTGGSFIDAASIPASLFGYDNGSLKLSSQSPLAALLPTLGLIDSGIKAVGEVRNATVGRVNEDGEREYKSDFTNSKRFIPLGGTPQFYTVMNFVTNYNK